MPSRAWKSRIWRTSWSALAIMVLAAAAAVVLIMHG
jgi:hypothetical protein